jgi:hypothetical protein
MPAKRLSSWLAGLLIAIVTVSATADEFEIDWFTIDGGGGYSSDGGEFELEGTIGQPDASPALAGGEFELIGGFWVVATGPCQSVPGDCDCDGDVDLDDYVAFESCLLGVGGGVAPECECFDLDDDGQVTVTDFAVFQVTFTGS